MGESLDERELSAADLQVRLLETPLGGRSFGCGEKALDDFLITGEALEFQREGLGKTHLAFHGDDLVGYLTVSLAEVRIEYLTSWGPAARMVAKGLEAIPALKVGRLAVDSRFQGRGVGKALVWYLGGLALAASRTMGVRLLTLQAKPQSAQFYARLGFQFAAETRRERKRKNRTMFLDLQAAERVV